MAAKNRKTNITGLIIDLQSCVISQNVRFLYRYPIRLLYIILMISIWLPKSKMAAKNCKTNVSGFIIIDIHNRVICQNVCFLKWYKIRLLFIILIIPIWPPKSKMAAKSINDICGFTHLMKWKCCYLLCFFRLSYFIHLFIWSFFHCIPSLAALFSTVNACRNTSNHFDCR